MRGHLILICATLLSSLVSGQQAAPPKASDQALQTKKEDHDTALTDLFAAKIKVEWDALKNKDKKAYGELLADDYQGVEADGQGERNKVQAIAEVPATNVTDYSLWGLKVTPLGPDTTFIVYEVTMQFPPRSVIRLSRIYIGALWVKQNGQWKELHYQETHVK